MKPAESSAIRLILSLLGCRTLEDVLAAKGGGTHRTYQATFERVWKAIPKAAGDLRLAIAGADENERYVLARRGMSAFSYGERVAIFVTPESATVTSVEVVSRRAWRPNLTAADFERPLLVQIGARLREEP